MHYKQLLLLLMTTFALNFTSLNAQINFSQPSSLTKVSNKLLRIERMTTRGPHYKNPKAAGRLLTLNRSFPDTVTSSHNIQLFGPAYKRRLIRVIPTDSVPHAPATKPRLMGPRYKNQSAKAH